jgi:nucleoid-associated protein YgaU
VPSVEARRFARANAWLSGGQPRLRVASAQLPSPKPPGVPAGVRAGIIDRMTDRGLPSADGSSACPFVAFEDDRDERADRPDHRHRCFAESEPAPRALAHQEAYCLSSAFPVCPTFQEWARREAARAIHVAAAAAAVPADDDEMAAAATGGAAMGALGADSDDGEPDDLWSQPRPEPPLEERPRRNPPRDWAAPPPWASGPGGGGPRREGQRQDEDADVAAPEEGRGLAGSAADRLARGADVAAEWGRRSQARPLPFGPDSPSVPADPDLAGLVGRAARQAEAAESHAEVRPPTRPARRPTVSSTRDRGRNQDRDLERERAEREGNDGPAWERRRRYEAYPSIKTRAGLSGLPAIPTVGVLFGGVVLAAIILFFLPALLGVGGRDPGGATSSTSPSAAEASSSLEPTPIPAPTPQIYVIKSGDTLSRIAREFNVTLDALLEANKDRISNPNRIKVGDEIIIPVPVTEEVPAEASPSAS